MMDLNQAMTDQTDVSLTLTHHVASTVAKDTNLVFSPLSLQLLLSMVAAGTAGPTRDELLSFFKSKSLHELNMLSSRIVSRVFADGSHAGGPKLSYGNGVWVDQSLPLKPSFSHIVDKFFRANVGQVDFMNKAPEVTFEVNSWAENQTNGLIKELLPPGSVDNSTRLILANALYFKGAWNEKFDASDTEEDDFYLLSGSSIKVPFMTSMTDQFINNSYDFKVLRLPYEQGEDNRQFSMCVFLPNEIDGLSALVEKVKSQPGFLNQHIPRRRVEVGNFKLPKFKFSFGFEASDVLKGLGVNLPFSEGGLTEMVDSNVGQKLAVSGIFHKSFIEVDEEGTEAAAASAAENVYLCYISDDPPEDFVADHPFMFMIREDTTGAVLFIGHVMDPSL